MKNLSALLLCASALHPAPRFENALEMQKAEIASLKTQLATANDTIAERDASLKTVTGERDSARADASSLTGELATANKTIAGHVDTIAQRDAEITGLKASATSVEKKAAQLLAEQGHAPLAIGSDPATSAGAKPKGSLIEQYNALTGEERTAFYAKHHKDL